MRRSLGTESPISNETEHAAKIKAACVSQNKIFNQNKTRTTTIQHHNISHATEHIPSEIFLNK